MTLRTALLQLVKGGAERQAIDAGEIDAIVDHASSKVILFPTARRALREEALIPNRLLAALPHAEYKRLRPALYPVTLTFGEVLYEPGAPIRHVYFPVNCVVSLLATVQGHNPVEVGMVGYEGMVGIPLALGVDVSSTRALVQGTGFAMRMEATRFRKEFPQSLALQQAVHRYTNTLMAQMAQTAACNLYHTTEQRLARLLLMTRDRVQSNQFRLTQEFLSEMLGVQRAGVSVAASTLQKRKLIKYRRGVIAILDRQGLRASSCECYTTIKRQSGSNI